MDFGRTLNLKSAAARSAKPRRCVMVIVVQSAKSDVYQNRQCFESMQDISSYGRIFLVLPSCLVSSLTIRFGPIVNVDTNQDEDERYWKMVQ